jgi:hypothetical protein
MKKITEGATKLIRVTTPLLAALLTVGVTAAQAGILDTINNKVTTVQNRTGTILNNTNGVQELVTNVRGITSGFRSGVVSDLTASLGEAQDLIAYLKEQRESAGSPADYPDLSLLITSLESIVGVLQDNPNGGDFGVLSQLVQVLPDNLLAVAGRVASKAGVDGDFVNRVNQAATDLALLKAAIAQDEADQNAQMQPPGPTPTALEPGMDTLPSPTNCGGYNSNRYNYQFAALNVLGIGVGMKLMGELMAGMAQTTGNAKEVGIHGYVSINIETDAAGALGKIYAGIGSGMIAIAGSVNTKLRHCEILYHQAEIMESNQKILDSNQDVLNSNAVLLEEVCAISRYRSANCQALLP